MKKYSFLLVLLLIVIDASSQEKVTFKTNKRVISGVLNIPHETIQYRALPTNILPKRLQVSTSKRNNLLINDSIVILSKNPHTGNPSFIKKLNSLTSAKLKLDGSLKNSSDALNKIAYSALTEIGGVLGIEQPEHEFKILDNEIDERGNIHFRIKQTLSGLPVYGGDVMLHINNHENSFHLNGNYYHLNDVVDTTVLLSEQFILQQLEYDLSVNKKYTLKKKNWLGMDFSPVIDKVLYPSKDFTTAVIAYHIQYWPNSISKWDYYINAKDGSILRSYQSSCSIEVPKMSSGKDLNGNTRAFGTVLIDNKLYAMIDASRPMYNATKGTGYILTYDNRNDTASKIYLVSSSNDTWDAKSVSAHYNAIMCYEYFRSVHGRNSIDNKGMTIYSIINAPDPVNNKSMDNAYWNGKYMYYGNGLTAFKAPLQAAEDIATHEMTHGITQFTAGLEYFAQSGAINESMSDVFGALVDSANWLIGEKVANKSIFPSGAIRDMSNPHNGGQKIQDGYWSPEHMSEYYSGEYDNQGVHFNSGIPNFAFYKIASDPLMGRTKAGKIYYQALTKYLTPQSQFSDLRLAVIQSAKDLYGNTEVAIISKAFDAVGITENVPVVLSDTLKVNPGTEYLLTYDTDRSDPNGLFRRSSSGSNYKVILNKTVASKPSITDNGKIAVFVGTDKKLYSLSMDPNINAEKTVLQDQTIWANVAISKDGKRMAAVTEYADTSIYVYDFDKKAWYRYMLYAPTYTYGIDAKGPIYADGLEWDYTGQNIIFDCLNVYKDSTGKNLSYWDIGMINVWNTVTNSKAEGKINKLFSLSDGISIGNPTFSKNFPGKIAFDFFDELNDEYLIIGYDMKLNKIKLIAANNTIGYPSYDKVDERVAFGTDSSGISIIKYVNLQADKISSTDYSKRLVGYAKWPVFFTFGNRNIVVPPKPVITSNGSNGICTGQSVTLTSSSDKGNQWYKNGLKIATGTAKTFQATESGNYMVIVTIDSVSSVPSSPIAVVVNQPPTKPTVTRDAQGFLVSSSINNNQWYKETTYTGDTTQKYKPTTSGYYTVKVVRLGCASEGATYYYLVNSIEDSGNKSKTTLFPNPTKNILILKNINNSKAVYYSIFDMNAKLIISKQRIPRDARIQVGSLVQGNYIIQLRDASGKIVSTQQLIKE